MKRCTQCDQTYNDDNLNYCLLDGTSLTTESEKTIAMQKSPAQKKSRFLLWLGLIGLIVLAGIGVIVGLFIYNYSKQGESVRVERQNGVNLPPSPTLPATPRITPTATVATSSPVEESSPKTEESKPSPNNTDAEDITPINWDTIAGSFKGEDGTTYKFRCPKAGTEHTIYGSDIYGPYSSICTAAVHAGLISLADGGIVTIEYRPSRSIYGSTVRHGIKSETGGGSSSPSFVVR